MPVLKAGERVKIIKKILGLANKQSIDDLPLIYSQFGVEYVRWREEDKVIVSPKLEEAPGDRLVELYEFLVSDVKDEELLPRTTNEPKCWEPKRFKLFLSHVSKEKKLVSAIKAALAPYGICSFVAHEDIEPIDTWIDEITKALETCHAIAALLTPTFHESRWTDQEVGYCLARGVPILPVRLGMDPYGFMAKIQGLPGGKDPEEIAKQVVDVLLKRPETALDMANALVDQFANSPLIQGCTQELFRTRGDPEQRLDTRPARPNQDSYQEK
jgi:hypothetical protein